MKTHSLKTVARFFDAINDGRKKVEVRVNDRDFQCGDLLRLVRLDDPKSKMSSEGPQTLLCKVTHILTDWGVQEGYVAMSIRLIKQHHHSEKEGTENGN